MHGNACGSSKYSTRMGKNFEEIAEEVTGETDH